MLLKFEDFQKVTLISIMARKYFSNQ